MLTCTIRFTPALFAASKRILVLATADSNVDWPLGNRTQYVLIRADSPSSAYCNFEGWSK